MGLPHQRMADGSGDRIWMLCSWAHHSSPSLDWHGNEDHKASEATPFHRSEVASSSHVTGGVDNTAGWMGSGKCSAFYCDSCLGPELRSCEVVRECCNCALFSTFRGSHHSGLARIRAVPGLTLTLVILGNIFWNKWEIHSSEVRATHVLQGIHIRQLSTVLD